MKTQAPWWLATMLFLSAGCVARPDWIQATLVTADVTGTWRGRAGSSTFTLVLKQQGPKVMGTIGTGTGVFAAVEGSVEGDVFRFAQTFGQMKGEATVAEDEMTGEVSGGYLGSRSRLFLRRGESSVPDTQEKR